MERLERNKGIPPERMQEIAKAEREGRLVILPAPRLATCGSCAHFQRERGTSHGECEKRLWRKGEASKMVVFQAKPCCRLYEWREME